LGKWGKRMKRAGLVVAVGALLLMLSAAVATAVVRSGTSGKDVLYGTAYADRIYGYAGGDEIYGGRGNDRLLGGPGNDRIFGDIGIDRLYGGSGDDFISVVGGRSKDYVDCGPGFDTIKKERGPWPSDFSPVGCEKTVDSTAQ
jgi:Ca2+-binding RTX toxin-like protein